MAVAYILEQGAYLTKEGERILVKKNKTLLHTIHAFKLEQMVIFGNVSITPAVISYLLKLGIDTVFMSKDGRYRGRLQGPYSKNIELRKRQFERLGDPSFCLKTAKYIVEGKINNLRTLLLRINRNREDVVLDDQILMLKILREKTSEANSLDEVRGFEGKASALYFEGFSKGLINETVEFTRRIRRPPTDPVNSLLSLGYTFLFNEVMGAVSMVGLDPYLGSLHSVEYGRPSLPLDLMEEWRPIIVDSLVLSMFNLRIVDIHSFVIAKDQGDEENTSHESPVKLTPEGMRKFITQFERKIGQKIRYHLTGTHLSYRDCIREQVRHFARYLKGENDTYVPITFR